ncbi:uncharacterized protein LOC135491256 [Lineus longissimus]|uniref:uncharacterized protein LOC135491256 n=1 Tax=Lineus longissimus TaxID=88925 RepID=UPI002B4D84EF
MGSLHRILCEAHHTLTFQENRPPTQRKTNKDREDKMADERMNNSLGRLFDMIDTDKNDGGVVTSGELFNAFLKFATSADAMNTLSNIGKYLMDADGDGRVAGNEQQITKENFVKKMGYFHDQWTKMDGMFKDIDTNDDEAISAKEIEDHKVETPQWLKEAIDAASEGEKLKRHEIFLRFLLTTSLNLPTAPQ